MSLNSAIACLPMLRFCIGGRSGNILAGVGRGQVQAGVEQGRIKIFGLLEEFTGLVVLAILERGDTFVEEVAGFQFIATGKSGGQYHQRDESLPRGETKLRTEKRP